MFYVIFTAVILFALYVILHDSREGGGKAHMSRKSSARPAYRPEQNGGVPLTPVSPTPKPLEPAPVVNRPVAARPAVPAAQNRFVSERPLSWSYLYSLDYDANVSGVTMRTEIAGMRHYCAFADVGLVNGIVRPEPGNPHDPRAQVVIRADGKKLGYIPRYALDEYENFNPEDLTCPFSGRVTVDNKGYMRADILVALPESREYVKDVLSAFMESL